MLGRPVDRAAGRPANNTHQVSVRPLDDSRSELSVLAMLVLMKNLTRSLLSVAVATGLHSHPPVRPSVRPFVRLVLLFDSIRFESSDRPTDRPTERPYVRFQCVSLAGRLAGWTRVRARLDLTKIHKLITDSTARRNPDEPAAAVRPESLSVSSIRTLIHRAMRRLSARRSVRPCVCLHSGSFAVPLSVL